MLILLNSLLETLGWLLGAGAVCYGIETLRPFARKHTLAYKDFINDMSFALLTGALVAPVAGLGFIYFYSVLLRDVLPPQLFAPTIQSWPFVLQILVGLLLIDLTTYARHRLTHLFAWRFHAVHHSATEIYWLTKHRGHPGDVCISLFFTIGVQYYFGFSGSSMLVAATLYNVIDYIHHANLRFGFHSWLRYVLASPQFHRWHHAVEPAAMNKNFAVVFAGIDWVFGTYYCPRGVFPSAYGLSGAAGAHYPSRWRDQLLYPFWRR
jgi:sterol desaturase/sphingolipid hydroxylase (fatty acid hydroxylase superfamily)